MSIIFALAIPIIIENLLQTLLGTIDTYFAGKLSDHAIAGIGVTNLIMNIFISLFTAVSLGSIAVISRNYGKKDIEKVNQSIVQSLLLSVMAGIFIGFVCGIFYHPILTISGADSDIIHISLPYYFIISIPCVFLSVQLALSSCLRAIKNTKTPMYATGFANVCNILLNMLFMKLGFGIFGLGLATTLSRMIAMLLLYWKLKNYNKQIQLHLRDFKYNAELFHNILHIGVPAGMEKLIMRIGQLIYNSMIIALGTNIYVAHNIAGSIESYAYIPAMGFGLAVSTIVGISLGEKDISKAKEMTHMTYYISAISMSLIGIIFYIFAPQLASLFTKTESVQNMSASVLRIIALFQPFSALTQIMTNALQGAGDTKYPMYSTFIGIWGIRIGLGYILAILFDYGLIGVWCAYAFDLVIRGTLLYLRFRKGKWQKITI